MLSRYRSRLGLLGVDRRVHRPGAVADAQARSRRPPPSERRRATNSRTRGAPARVRYDRHVAELAGTTAPRSTAATGSAPSDDEHPEDDQRRGEGAAAASLRAGAGRRPARGSCSNVTAGELTHAVADGSRAGQPARRRRRSTCRAGRIRHRMPRQRASTPRAARLRSTAAVVVELERHVAAAGWDGPVRRVRAGPDRRTRSDRDPALAGRLPPDVVAAARRRPRAPHVGRAGGAARRRRTLETLLGRIAWPADGGRRGRRGRAVRAAAGGRGARCRQDRTRRWRRCWRTREREDVRLAVGVLRDGPVVVRGAHRAARRRRRRSATGPDLAPGLVARAGRRRSTLSRRSAAVAARQVGGPVAGADRLDRARGRRCRVETCDHPQAVGHVPDDLVAVDGRRQEPVAPLRAGAPTSFCWMPPIGPTAPSASIVPVPAMSLAAGDRRPGVSLSMMPSANISPGARAADVVDADRHVERERERRVEEDARAACRPSASRRSGARCSTRLAVPADRERDVGVRRLDVAAAARSAPGRSGTARAVDRDDDVPSSTLSTAAAGASWHTPATVSVAGTGMPSALSAAAVALSCERDHLGACSTPRSRSCVCVGREDQLVRRARRRAARASRCSTRDQR